MHDGQPETKSVQVLLILIQHGANGLNLLEAQHVILVEPLLNPAAESQAISRVHRIGQKNKTLVHRFIVCSFFFKCMCHFKSISKTLLPVELFFFCLLFSYQILIFTGY